MNKKHLLSSIVSLLLIGSSFTYASIKNKTNELKTHLSSTNDTAQNEAIIVFKDGVDKNRFFSILFKSHTNTDKHSFKHFNSSHIKIPNMSYEEIKNLIQNNPILKNMVKRVEPNYQRAIQESSNDSYYSKLWAIENVAQDVNGQSGTNDADMDVKEAWDLVKGNSNIVVAVLDTGVDYTHSDIEDNIWINPDTNKPGYDFAGDDDGNNDDDPMPDTPYDENGHYHGTHVAGIIGAIGDNSNGVSGVAQRVKIMPLKVFRPNGYGYTSDILEALDFIAEQKDKGVNIVAINASYGGSGGSIGDSIDNAIAKLGKKGIVFVAAAGNEGKDIDSDPVYPACYSASNIISVGASDQNDQKADFSNYGANNVDVFAPGTNILSLYPDNAYAYMQGTSMATPQVSGVIALLSSYNEDLNVTQKIDAIKNSVDEKSNLSGYSVTGGRVNAYSALQSVESQNNAPIANNDSVSVDEDNYIIIDVLENDSDNDGDSLNITSVTQPSNGRAEIVDNKIKYTPNANFNGSDSFSYTISDESANASATVNVTVNAVNDAPTISSIDDVTIDEDSNAITINLNANDVDNDSLTFSASSSNLEIADIEVKSDKLTITPKANQYGEADITVSVKDSSNASDSTTFKLKINQVNDAPSASNDNASVDEDNSIIIDVLANDSDIDGDSLSIKSLSSPNQGKAEIIDNKIKYTPNANYNGSDSFSYIVTDGTTDVSANVEITINRVNDAPSANNDSATTKYETKVTIDVLANDSDIDDDSLSIKSVSNPSNGRAQIVNGKIEYTPNNGFSGEDKFTYIITDGKLDSQAQVTVNVGSKENTPPSANNDSTQTEYNKSVLIDVLANDSDIDGDSLTIKSVNNPSNGKAEIVNNKIKYTPNSGFSGKDYFNYTISDTNNATANATVEVTVLEKPNKAPNAVDDKISTDEDTKVLINVLANDSDIDGDSLSIKSVSTPNHGKTKIINGKIEYTPKNNYNGSDSFEYEIKDGNGATSKATVNVTINAVNDAPIAKDDSVRTDYNKEVLIRVLDNDSDIDDDSLTIKSVTKPQYGSAEIVGDKIKYIPKKNFSGEDYFIYTITDGQEEVTAKVKVVVEGKDSFSFPIIGKDGIESKIKLHIKYIKKKHGDKTVFKLDNGLEVDAFNSSGEIEIKGANSPLPADKLPAGTVLEINENSLKVNVKLNKNIKFK